MALIVQKFGGTSVGDIERIRLVADRIIKSRECGHDLVVVVSAMAGETDRLVHLAHELSELPDPREFDVLLSTGEQVVIALLSIALIKKGCEARSYTGAQVHIRTDSAHNKARILGIDGSKIRSDLQAGKVVIVAGFQGTDEMGNITTLGRGGSDTTAVALAAALDADECQIYTDVDGVYTADPKIVPHANRMSQIAVEEMLEMASNGAKVMQIRAVEFAGKYNVPVRVLSTFKESIGTLIIKDAENMQHRAVSGIAFNQDEAKLVVYGIPDKPGVIAHILKPMSDAHIEVDMIVQTVTAENTMDLAFTVHKRDFKHALSILEHVSKLIGAKKIKSDERVAKLSLVGVGMRSHAGVASKMFYVLGREEINIQLISTSEIKISVIIDEQCLERGVGALHDAFQLGAEEKEAKEIEQC
jgi:aspartate kinase